jgi:hypothetical protein
VAPVGRSKASRTVPIDNDLAAYLDLKSSGRIQLAQSPDNIEIFHLWQPSRDFHRQSKLKNDPGRLILSQSELFQSVSSGFIVEREAKQCPLRRLIVHLQAQPPAPRALGSQEARLTVRGKVPAIETIGRL